MRASIAAIAGILAWGSASAQTTSFDGNYRNPNGTMGTGSSCATTRFGFGLDVHGGKAAMRTVTAGTLEGTVSADGRIDIMQGRAQLSGTFDGPKFKGSLSLGNQCRFDLDYTKS